MLVLLGGAAFVSMAARETAAQQTASAVRGDSSTVRYDSSAVEVRTPPDGTLSSYRTDPDFQYEEEAPAEGPGWLQRVLEWLFGTDSDREPLPSWTRWIVYALAGLGLAYGVLRLLGMDAAGLMRRRQETMGTVSFDVEDDLEAIDFDARIKAAVAGGRYRQALRLRYLQTLGHLADRGLIAWEPDKTNRAYVGELAQTELYRPFLRLTTLFEYAWYGEARVGAAAYEHVQQRFARFRRRLQDASKPFQTP